MNSAVRAGCSAVQNSCSSNVLFSASISRSSGRNSVLTMMLWAKKDTAGRGSCLPEAETLSIERIDKTVKGDQRAIIG